MTMPSEVEASEVDVDATEAEVLAIAAALVDAFGRGEKSTYFGFFAPDATFIFHSSPEQFGSRRAYEQEWESWCDDGWRVVSCRSLSPSVRVFSGSVAIFTHEVLTDIEVRGEHQSLHERESIIFTRDNDGSWLAVHEHLSPLSE